MTRRAKGEGSLHQDPRGRWVGQVDVGVNPATGKRRRVKVVGAEGESKADVATRLRERIAQLEHGGPVAPQSVGELVEAWLTRAAPKRKSPSSMTTARHPVETHVMPTFRHVRLSAVTVEDIEAWLDGLSGHLARASVQKIRQQLAQAFDYGLRRRHVSWNRARLAEMPPGTDSPREGRALTGSEARALLNVADHHRVGAWVTVAMTLGLRPGEVSGLTWEGLDLDNGRVVVHQSMAWDQNMPYLKATKTGKARTLDLPDRAVDTLMTHRKFHAEERLLMGRPLAPPVAILGVRVRGGHTVAAGQPEASGEPPGGRGRHRGDRPAL